MPRTCFILVAGLDQTLLQNHPTFLSALPHRSTYTPILPAVTSPMQATLTTGVTPNEHGIIANGLYTHAQPDLHQHLDLTNHADARTNVSFWEQFNALLQHPRFWKDSGKKVAMLFWQNSIGAADIVLTPKPVHSPDGKTLTACYSNPPELYPTLTEKFGPFPLHNYWSPMAGLPSSQWILKASEYIWDTHAPDLQLLYIPHLDYNLQRLGPTHPQIAKDLADIEILLKPFIEELLAEGHNVLIAGDYGMNPVDTPLFPNLLLRNANLLTTKPDPQNKLLIDYATSKAFALCDHQIAYLYIKSGHEQETLAALTPLNAVIEKSPTNPRAGQFQLLAPASAWFAHDYWLSDSEKPTWQFTVDIHNKPGYDPRELFFDPQHKCIAQNANLVKGSHGLLSPPPAILSNRSLPANPTATAIAPWLKSLL